LAISLELMELNLRLQACSAVLRPNSSYRVCSLADTVVGTTAV
jgi:hypothetical protein